MGAPYQISKNMRSDLLMANGSLCHVAIYPILFSVCKLMEIDEEIVEGLGPGIVSVFPVELKSCKMTFKRR